MRKTYLIACSVLAAFLCLTFFLRPITSINEDLGRHILLGSIIVDTLTVPSTNLLSYTYPDYPFINTTWMSAVYFFIVTSVGGFDLLLISTTLIVAGSIFLLIYFVSKRFSSVSVLFSAFLYMLLIMNRSDVRPEMFSMLFLALFSYILFSFREKYTRKIYALIFFELLWVNFHVYFFVGVLLVLFFLIDQAVSDKQFTRRVKALVIVLIGVIAATLINPNMLKGALYPIFIFTNYGFPVTENQNILLLFEVYKSPGVLFPLILLGSVVALLVLWRKKARPIDWMLFLFFGISMALIYRNILLFAFITFIPFVRLVDIAVKEVGRRIRHLPREPFLLIYCLPLFVLCCLIAWSMATNSFGLGVIDRGKRVADFVQVNKISGPFFNDSDIGGYLSYRLYPQKIFIDGRPEAFPSSFFSNEYFPMLSNFDVFEDFDEKYKFNAIMLKHADGFFHTIPLYFSLVRSDRFTLIYLDDYAMVFVRNNSQNKQIIEQNRVSENAVNFKNVKNSEMLLRYLSVAGKTGWDNMGSRVLAQLEYIDSRFCRLNSYKERLRQIEYFDVSQIQRCHYLPMSIY